MIHADQIRRARYLTHRLDGAGILGIFVLPFQSRHTTGSTEKSGKVRS